jgi:hypothetical protein
MDNIGFYSALGFLPGRLTITLTVDAATGDRPPELLARLGARDREETLAEAGALVEQLAPGYDFTREIDLTESLALGDTVIVRKAGSVAGVALCHTAPLVEGRTREELRVLKLALVGDEMLDPMIHALCDFAKRSGTRRVALRVQGDYPSMYRSLVALGARVRWTDLRMSLGGYEERPVDRGIVLSNWEI